MPLIVAVGHEQLFAMQTLTLMRLAHAVMVEGALPDRKPEREKMDERSNQTKRNKRRKFYRESF
jgi:hypothetical protein